MVKSSFSYGFSPTHIHVSINILGEIETIFSNPFACPMVCLQANVNVQNLEVLF